MIDRCITIIHIHTSIRTVIDIHTHAHTIRTDADAG